MQSLIIRKSHWKQYIIRLLLKFADCWHAKMILSDVSINRELIEIPQTHLIPAGLAPLKISKWWFFQIQPLWTWLLFHLQELSDFYMWMAFLYIQKQKHKRITIYYLLVLFLSVQLTFSSVFAIFFLFLQKIIFFYVIKGYSFHYHQIMTGLTSFLLQSKIHAQNEFVLTHNTCSWFIALIYTTKRRLKIFLSSKTHFLNIISRFAFSHGQKLYSYSLLLYVFKHYSNIIYNCKK